MPRVAVIGDYSERNETHRATNTELEAAGVTFEWVPTPRAESPADTLRGFDGLWISPGSPYASMQGALAAVRYAREAGVPLVGT
jgi:CTP synthase (UTP-ammonia lyase)